MIINFSSYQGNDDEKSLLTKQLDFAVPRILNRANYLLSFEIVYIDLKIMEVLSNDLQIIKVAFKEYAYNSFKKHNFLKEFNLSGDEYNALKNLSSLKNIIIQKSDEEKSAVLMNRDDYMINRMETSISDLVKFQKLSVAENKDNILTTTATATTTTTTTTNTTTFITITIIVKEKEPLCYIIETVHIKQDKIIFEN